MKTLHIEMGRHRLGGTMQVYYLLRGLKEKGQQPSLVCPKASPLAGMAKEIDIEVFDIPYAGDLDIRFPLHLRKIIRATSPDVIHIHSRRGADTLGLFSARLFSNAKIIISRRVDNPLRPGFLTQLRFGRLADHVVAVSKGIVRELEKSGVSPERISQIYSAIDVGAYQSPLRRDQALAQLGLSPIGPVIAVIGQLIRRKGHRFLLEAAPAVLQHHPQTRFVFLGEGEEEDRLKQLAQTLGVDDRVLFAGYRNDVGDILRGVDILVHPATMEGFANVALQAMAAGVPVISTAVGGMPESVRHGINGLLIPPRDVTALSQAMLQLLNDPALRHKMGKAGQEIVQNEFNIQSMIEGNLKLYMRVLGTN